MLQSILEQAESEECGMKFEWRISRKDYVCAGCGVKLPKGSRVARLPFNHNVGCVECGLAREREEVSLEG